MKFKMNDVEFEIIEMEQLEYKKLRVEEDGKDGCKGGIRTLPAVQ